MKVLGLLLCVVAAASAAPSPSYIELARGGRVVGGVDALPHEFPSIVSIHRLLLTIRSHICGGSIVNSHTILTAAHCITESGNNPRFEVVAGAHNILQNEASQQRRDVARWVVHPDYIGGVAQTDIAVMILASPVNFIPGVVAIAHLPGQNCHHPAEQPATLAGWGSTSGTQVPSMPAILQKVTKPIITWAECERANGGPGMSPLGETNVCTGPLTGGVSACSGDSGGPLYLSDNQRTQIGIVSWGWVPCGSFDRPSVYVNTACYRNWIDQHAHN
ncbi:trypsin-1-like [Uranotaenia lowii]|uniref:trypsin-1-like n=1 Tax=Uranotaenia lowii TaxID=190385 RepID=UPI00247AC670|nr:trypsin-1-like [Uranotaenia lowii]XP_055613840.1 trypsin-1-like [Uranotaenia lowii]